MLRSPTDLEEEEDEDSDEEDEVDEADEAGPSSSHPDEPSSSGSENVDASAAFSPKDEAGPSSSHEVSDSSTRVSEPESSPDTLVQARASEVVEMALEYTEPTSASPDSSTSREANEQAPEEPTVSGRDSESQIPSISNGNGDASPAGDHSTVENNLTGPLDFENYNTSKHLEVCLGLRTPTCITASCAAVLFQSGPGSM